MTNLAQILKKNHQALKIVREAMPMHFPATQKKKEYFIKGASQIQRMKRESLQRKMWIRIMDITTDTKQYFMKGPSQIQRMKWE